MKFTLAIHAAPGTSQSADSALRFAQAVLAQGHTIYRLFFYRDGVHNCTSLASPPQDETNLPASWQQFISQHQIDCVVCIAAALRRGVLDSKEANRYNKPASNLRDGCELSGLGQLTDACFHSDRLITFGP